MAEPVATLRRGGHSYDGRRWQFRDLDLDLRCGEVLAILGPNGRGKSTLLRAIARLLKLTEGSIGVSRSIGFVPQDFSGSFPYSVLDIVLMGRARHVPLLRNPTRADASIAMDALDSTGMTRFADHDFSRLSGGERQLVMIARALAGENTILLLDEPASALDLKNQDGVLSLLRDLADLQQLAVAFTTHQPNHALAVADDVLLMLDGTRTIHGPVAGVMNDENLEAVYGIPVRSLQFREAGRMRRTIVPIFRERPDSQQDERS